MSYWKKRPAQQATTNKQIQEKSFPKVLGKEAEDRSGRGMDPRFQVRSRIRDKSGCNQSVGESRVLLLPIGQTIVACRTSIQQLGEAM